MAAGRAKKGNIITHRTLLIFGLPFPPANYPGSLRGPSETQCLSGDGITMRPAYYGAHDGHLTFEQ